MFPRCVFQAMSVLDEKTRAERALKDLQKVQGDQQVPVLHTADAFIQSQGISVFLRDTSTLGGAGDRTSNLPVTSQPALPPLSAVPLFTFSALQAVLSFA